MAKEYTPKRAIELTKGGETEQAPSTELQLAKRAVRETFLPWPESVTGAHDDVRQALYDGLVGQRAAIDAVINTLDRRYARTDERPIAAMMFLGPTGVGKTEIAKQIVAAFIDRGHDANLVRVDCSTLGSKHDGSAVLLGAPAGYVGYKDDPVLACENFASPYSEDITVLLLDEIEKADPDTWRALMPVLDEGIVQLRNGDKTHFANTIIIATSNVGAAEISAALDAPLGFAPTDGNVVTTANINSVAQRAYKEHFKFMPEFAARFSTPIVFEPHTSETLTQVFATNMAARNAELRERFGVEVRASDAVCDRLVARAVRQSHLGARPLVQAIDEEIMSVAGKYMASGHLGQGERLLAFTSQELAEREGKVTDVDRLIFGLEYDASLKLVGTTVPLEKVAAQTDETGENEKDADTVDNPANIVMDIDPGEDDE